MQYNNIKLYKKVDSLFIPKNGVDDKNVSFFFFGENNNFFDAYSRMKINKEAVKHVVIPSIRKPLFSMMDPEKKDEIKEHGLRPIKSNVGDYSEVDGFNFFLDTSDFTEKLLRRKQVKKFKSGIAYKTITSIVNLMDGISKDMFKRVLIYTVNLDEPFHENPLNRKFSPILRLMFEYDKGKVESLPFDQLLLFTYSYEGSEFTLLYDSDEKLNLSKIKILLKNVKNSVEKNKMDVEASDATEDIMDKSTIVSSLDLDKDKVKNLVNSFVKKNEISSDIVDEENSDLLVVKSVLSRTIGNDARVNSISNKVVANIKSPKIQKFIKSHADKSHADKSHADKSHADKSIDGKVYVNEARSELVKFARPLELVDNVSPKNIVDMRKVEFNQNLVTDIVGIFKTLENEDLPLKFKDIKITTIESGVGELEKSIKDIYTILLIDEKKEEHIIKLELPHLNNDNTFLVNGKKKMLVTQIITYPIFFFKPYSGSFESSYSTLSIHSKRLASSSYLFIHIGSYKLPLAMLLSLKLGFDKAMKLFDLEYTISEERKSKDAIKLPNGKYIYFKIDTELHAQLAESFNKSLSSLKVMDGSFDLNSVELWREAISSFTGTRNSIHIIDQIWTNIVTPISKDVLQTKNHPTDITNIIKYITEKVVTGFVDDRNDINKMRIRLSEMFTSLLQKQVGSAYSEYLSKKMGGDENAKLYVNSTKIYSQVINSQTVQEFESVNPLEELSMELRVTPVGIGGLTNTRAFPERARNIHESYYGNIDPLESPEGANIGIQQHLAMGASILNNRGLFSERDRKDISPSAILSATPAMIPFVEKNEGARINMATGQAKQAFPLKNLENPVVQSGYESILTPLLSDNFIIKSPENGKVIEIAEEFISIEDVTGKLYSVDTSPKTLKSGQGKNGLSVFHPVVKVGEKVKYGEIIAEGANIKDGLISNGLNMFCAFMPWKGYNFEDGMVISESAAKKFISLHNEEYEVLLTEEDKVINIVNLGDELHKGSVLITYSNVEFDIESYKSKRSENGRVVKIEIFNNLPKDSEIPKNLIPLYKDYVKLYKTLNDGIYPQGKFKVGGEKFEGIMIRFVIAQELVAKHGDKLNNRYFNKGVISIIEKDENMPQMPDGKRIEMIYNPLSLINRMNPGQLYELHSGFIGYNLGELIGKKSRKDFTELYSKVLGFLDGTKDKKYSKNTINGLKGMSDKRYENLKDKVTKRGFVPLIFPPFKSPSIDNLLSALSYLGLKTKYHLRLPEYNKITESAIAVGFIYVFRLEHIASKKIHARGLGPYVSKTLAPTTGKSRGGGALMGEYDLYSLLSYDANFIIDEFFGPLSSDHGTKNEMVSEIIQAGTTDFRQAKDNPVKEMYHQYMTAIHLNAD